MSCACDRMQSSVWVSMCGRSCVGVHVWECMCWSACVGEAHGLMGPVWLYHACIVPNMHVIVGGLPWRWDNLPQSRFQLVYR